MVDSNKMNDPEVLIRTLTCRAVAEEMATTGLPRMQVVDRETERVVGTIGAAELLAGRRRSVRRESERRIAFSPLSERDQTDEKESDFVSR
jgi:hypothetical protein